MRGEGGRRSSRATARRAADARARAVRVLVVDLEGALTDGRVLIDARGSETRAFHEADRLAIAVLRRAGIEVVALAGRRPRARPGWVRALGVSDVVGGGGRGLDTVRRHCRRRRLGLDAVAYVAHDVLELPLVEAVGLAIGVGDAPDQVKRVSHWIAATTSGGGVVREVAERILRAQGKWASTIGEIWRRWD